MPADTGIKIRITFDTSHLCNQMNSDTVESEIAKLQGTWKQATCEIDGVPDAVDESGRDPRVTFVGDEFIVTRADGNVVIKGRFRLDPSKTPKTIDWMDTFGADAGKTLPAIYYLEENKLVFCAADGGEPRPTEFRAKAGHVLRIHLRQTGLTIR